MKHFKVAFLALILIMALALPAFALGIEEDGSKKGQATDINFTTNLDVSTTNNGVPAVGVTASPTFTTVIATQYVQMQYFSKLTRPASGAPVGSQISMKGANSGDCGADNTGSNTTFVVCVSDGTNWKSIS